MLISDPNLEDYLREVGGLPPADHNNAMGMGVAPNLTQDEQALIDNIGKPVNSDQGTEASSATVE